jgi:hypothetical protein
MICDKCTYGIMRTACCATAYNGWWYDTYHCDRCYNSKDVVVRQVDIKNDRDCMAADASQGIL